MTKRHAHVVHMAKYMNMVGAPVWWGALDPGPLGSPLNPALQTVHNSGISEKFRCRLSNQKEIYLTISTNRIIIVVSLLVTLSTLTCQKADEASRLINLPS